jgi:hypothetical protein
MSTAQIQIAGPKEFDSIIARYADAPGLESDLVIRPEDPATIYRAIVTEDTYHPVTKAYDEIQWCGHHHHTHDDAADCGEKTYGSMGIEWRMHDQDRRALVV